MTAPDATTTSQKTRLPLVIYVLAVGTFLMGTTEFVVAGLLPEMASDFNTTVAHAGLSITIFAVGMIVGAPAMALATLRLPRRITLSASLAVFALGHVAVALTTGFELMLAARFVTAVATGAFWAVGSAAAARAAGPEASSRALGLVLGGGMLANVLGVPLGSISGQLIGWRGTFWALAVLAALAAVGVARLVPYNPPPEKRPTVLGELRVLRNGRLWLVLITCAVINAGVLSVYSYIAPLITDSAGLSGSVIPYALMAFGVGALVGNIVGGRLGDTHPYATSFVTAGVTVIACAGIWAFSSQPALLLALFALLGLVGLSANPIMVSLAVRFGGESDALAAAMPASIFNLGTAIGTGLTSSLLLGTLGASAPAVVGVVFGVLIFVPLGILAFVERRTAPVAV
ncbi:MFS transporter [Microbacterium sp. ISL-103]|uniref:MFS transporter n=1 Tax=Microbacterium sp. ISL-103 TaxID=2819156 RepID=UPI001BE736D4|nr:MFS transporter [Microbacterium sp. ISL-103]MBT2475809.1 MFS transporter [Microbacterium sp. ISL-103]